MKKVLIILATIIWMNILWGCGIQNSSVVTGAGAPAQDTRKMSDEEVLIEACKYAKAQCLDHQRILPYDRMYIIFYSDGTIKVEERYQEYPATDRTNSYWEFIMYITQYTDRIPKQEITIHITKEGRVEVKK